MHEGGRPWRRCSGDMPEATGRASRSISSSRRTGRHITPPPLSVRLLRQRDAGALDRPDIAGLLPSARADPAPVAHDGDLAEQRRLQRQHVEAGHVQGRFDATQRQQAALAGRGGEGGSVMPRFSPPGESPSNERFESVRPGRFTPLMVRCGIHRPYGGGCRLAARLAMPYIMR